MIGFDAALETSELFALSSIYSLIQLVVGSGAPLDPSEDDMYSRLTHVVPLATGWRCDAAAPLGKAVARRRASIG